jgi:hypothetical protein
MQVGGKSDRAPPRPTGSHSHPPGAWHEGCVTFGWAPVPPLTHLSHPRIEDLVLYKGRGEGGDCL